MVSRAIETREKALTLYMAVIKAVKKYGESPNLCFKEVDGIYIIAFSETGQNHSIVVGAINVKAVLYDLQEMSLRAFVDKLMRGQQIG